jgi:hypothetical protein
LVSTTLDYCSKDIQRLKPALDSICWNSLKALNSKYTWEPYLGPILNSTIQLIGKTLEFQLYSDPVKNEFFGSIFRIVESEFNRISLYFNNVFNKDPLQTVEKIPFGDIDLEGFAELLNTLTLWITFGTSLILQNLITLIIDLLHIIESLPALSKLERISVKLFKSLQLATVATNKQPFEFSTILKIFKLGVFHRNIKVCFN